MRVDFINVWQSRQRLSTILEQVSIIEFMLTSLCYMHKLSSPTFPYSILKKKKKKKQKKKKKKKKNEYVEAIIVSRLYLQLNFDNSNTDGSFTFT